MKDITQETIDAIFSDEELAKRQKITLHGVETEMPVNLLKDSLPDKFLLVDRMDDILENYKMLSEKKSMSRGLVKWLIKDVALKTDARTASETTKSIKSSKTELDDVAKEDISVIDRMRFKVMPKYALHVTGVTIRNKQSIASSFFNATLMDLVDSYGGKIQAVTINDNMFEQLIAPNDERAQGHAMKEKLDQMSMDENNRPFIISCFAMKRKEPRLFIRRVQDGGRTVEPFLPMIGQ